MSNDNARRTRSTSGNAPMGSTVAIVVTAIAIVLGFLILRKINDDDNGGAIKPTTTTTTTIAGGVTTTLPSQVTTTTTALVKTGTKVQVANASNASGVAKAMSTALATEGFDLAAATNSTANPARLAPRPGVSRTTRNRTEVVGPSGITCGTRPWR